MISVETVQTLDGVGRKRIGPGQRIPSRRDSGTLRNEACPAARRRWLPLPGDGMSPYGGGSLATSLRGGANRSRSLGGMTLSSEGARLCSSHRRMKGQRPIMTFARQYAGAIRKQLEQIEATQLSAVEAAGAICAAALCHDRWIYAFGRLVGLLRTMR